MKKNIFLCSAILITTGVSFFLSSCDKIENPYPATTTTGPGDTSGTKLRKILIEDFTGQKCGNCPTAAVTINTIKNLHPEQIISIAVHANFYAVPGAAPYTYDFRTAEGNAYDAFFSPPNFPNGMINRMDYPTSNHWKSVTTWSSIVDTMVTAAPEAYIEITNTYNTTSRVLNTSIKSEFLKATSGSYKLAVMLTEDSIIKPQTDYSMPVGQQDVMNYVHRHALRGGITGSWGDALVSGSIAAGDTVVKTYNYTLPATYPSTAVGIAPNEDLCYVIAYIYDAITYRVIQVEEKKIK